MTHMTCMFEDASSFNQPITMDTSNVIYMNRMFFGATAMTHPVPSITEAAAAAVFDRYRSLAKEKEASLAKEKEAAVSNFFLEVLQIKIKLRSLIIFFFLYFCNCDGLMRYILFLVVVLDFVLFELF